MVLKIILILIVIYFLYRFLGGKFSLPKRENSSSSIDDENTLVECSKCGVYITQKESIKIENKIYCSDCVKEK